MKEVLRYYKKYIPYIIAIMIVLFGQVICELLLPSYMSDIIDRGVIPADMKCIRDVGLIMIIIAAGAGLCAVLSSLFSSLVAAKATRRMRRDLFSKITKFTTGEFEHFSTASLITRSTNDMQMIQQATVMFLRMMLFAPVMGIGAVIMALRTSVALSWTVGLALLCVLGLMIFSFVAVFPRFRVMQEKLDRINLIMKERLSGTLVIRAFRKEREEEDRFDEANVDLTRLYVFVNRCLAFMMPTMTFIMSGVGILIVWQGAQLIEMEKLLIGDMLAYLQYAMHVIMSFMFVTMIFVMLPRAAVSARRIGEVLCYGKMEEAEEYEGVSIDRDERIEELEFRNVSFAYPGSEEMVLENISFKGSAGEVTAIIGGTGSGKTTLVNLIPRLYEVTAGEILVDGKDIRDIPPKDLREKIGIVPQKMTLFSGTIESNLRYGKEEATHEEMDRALEIAQARSFVIEKDKGLEREITQGGTNVSGGQKQRLCIGRAIVRDPDILIFDDSFSALDFRTDRVLREALEENTGDKILIIVAQRINTIMNADRIIVLHDGEIAGIGRHQELLKDCQIYREIALSQLSEEELGLGERGQEI